MMKFVWPAKEHESRAVEFISEFRVHSARIHGVGGLTRYVDDSSYNEWLDKLQNGMDILNIPEGFVASTTYFYMGGDRIIGMINIRLSLNERLKQYGGHIGYCIRPTEWNKGHGTRMLREALPFINLVVKEDILIFCDKDNPASAKVITNNGGILLDEYIDETDGKLVQKYAIRQEKI